MLVLKGYADYNNPCLEIISRYLKIEYYSEHFLHGVMFGLLSVNERKYFLTLSLWTFFGLQKS